MFYLTRANGSDVFSPLLPSFAFANVVNDGGFDLLLNLNSTIIIEQLLLRANVSWLSIRIFWQCRRSRGSVAGARLCLKRIDIADNSYATVDFAQVFIDQ